jgi:transposase-like protein
MRMENSDSTAQREQLKQEYAKKNDIELQELAEEALSLTETAREILKSELTRRGLSAELSLSPEIEPTIDLVLLRRFRDQPEALVAKSALESAGIESFVGDATTIRMDWLWSNALGGLKLFVRKDDLERATRILNEEIPSTFEVAGVGEYAQPRCPACQSLDITFEDLSKPMAYGGIMLGLPINLRIDRWTCHSCGNVWQDSEESSSESK